MRARLVAAAVVGILGGNVALAQAPDSRPKKGKVDVGAAAYQEALHGLRMALLELATWCADQKLFREQARQLEAILVLEPDDAAARAGLGYEKARSGGWERSPKWKEQGNKNPEGLGDFKKKRAEVAGVFFDAATKILEENKRDIAPGLRARIVGDMTAIDANDPRTRRAGGEEEAGGKWVLAETAASPPRRKRIQAWTKAAIATAGKPDVVDPAGNEENFGVKWGTILETENLRVLGTGSKDETTKIAILCQAAGELFSKVFGAEVTHQTAFHVPIYVLADPTTKAEFLRNHPGIKPDEREKVAALGGFHLQGGYVIWGAESEGRIDCAVRMVIGSFMNRQFGLGGDDGALYEGIGIHLTWFLTGTRLTWTVGERKYAQSGPEPLADKLRKAGADWFTPGYELWGGKSHPPLKPLLAKHLNDLMVEDMLASFAIGVWLIEGREHDAPRFLRAAGRKEVDAGSLEAFGLEINQLEERIARWAKESRGK
jgi:hypothetical protein